MSAPSTTPFADDVAGRLAPVMAGDDSRGYPFLLYLVGLSQMFARVEAVARAQGARAAWGVLLDPDLAPDWLLPWLGQFVGVAVTPGTTPDQQRAQIKAEGGFRRGTVAALIASVQATGPVTVSVIERDGGPGLITVVTRSPETPDPAAAEAAARAAKAAGLILTYVNSTSETWAEATSTWDTPGAGVTGDSAPTGL
jgi:hypothetical protein